MNREDFLVFYKYLASKHHEATLQSRILHGRYKGLCTKAAEEGSIQKDQLTVYYQAGREDGARHILEDLINILEEFIEVKCHE